MVDDDEVLLSSDINVLDVVNAGPVLEMKAAPGGPNTLRLDVRIRRLGAKPGMMRSPGMVLFRFSSPMVVSGLTSKSEVAEVAEVVVVPVLVVVAGAAVDVGGVIVVASELA